MIVFFDIDDTLLDDRAATRAGVTALHRLTADTVPFHDLVSRWTAAIERHFPRYLAGEVSYEGQRRDRVRDAIDANLTDAVADRLYAEYFGAYEQAWTVFDDVLPCLEALQGHRLGIISNGHREQQRRKLDRTKIADRFDSILISDDCSWSKPSPEIFLHACRMANVAPADAVYVGDRYDVDASAARRAGLTGIWLDRGRTRNSDHDAPIVTSLTEVVALALTR